MREQAEKCHRSMQSCKAIFKAGRKAGSGCATAGEAGSMTGLTDEQKTEYFRRSYTAVDGLWFMKVEERLGFDEALRLDEAVWKVLPKIQARALKGMMHLQGGLQGLEQALSARLALEGFEYEIEPREEGFAVIVKRCPWHDLMIKSGRGESFGAGKRSDLPGGKLGVGERVFGEAKGRARAGRSDSSGRRGSAGEREDAC